MGNHGQGPAKKPPATAIGVQNGQRVVLTGEGGEPFELPEEIKNERALEAWDGYWADPVSKMLTAADKSVVIRWISMVDRYWRLMEQADENPTMETKNNGEAAHPLYKVALAMENQIERLETKLGIGPKSRALLGIQILGFEQGKREYERNNAPTPPSAPVEDDEEDPRL